MDYPTLSMGDKLQIARDALRGVESDHYRMSLLVDSQPGAESRMAQLEAEAETLRAKIAKLEAEAAAEQERIRAEAEEAQS